MRKVFFENTDPNNSNYNASIKLLNKIIQTTCKAREKFTISANYNKFFSAICSMVERFSPIGPQPNKTLYNFSLI
jgi:hypothetical protein